MSEIIIDLEAIEASESTEINLETYFYPMDYFSDSNNNFSFFCEYNAPSGEVNFVFPDHPCSSFEIFEGWSGIYSSITEILVADIYPCFTGETADFSLLTFSIIGETKGYSGELNYSTLSITQSLSSDAFGSEYCTILNFTIPVRAEINSQGLAGENLIPDLQTSDTFIFDFFSGEINNITALILNRYSDYIKSEGPSAYWKMDEQSGTSAIDYTGNNSPAVYTNGPILANVSPVASRYSVYLDGTNDTIVGNPLITSNNLTQELWVKPAAGATITLYTPASTGTQGMSGQRWAVYPNQNGSGSGGGISVGSNGIQVCAHGSSYLPVLLSYQQAISTTSFTHILVSWNDRIPTLYVNGVAVATGFQARSPFTSYGLPYSGTYGYYKGYIQDVAIYSSALTAEQAREHYLAGIGLHFLPHFEPVTHYSGEINSCDLTIDQSVNLETVAIFDGTFSQINLSTSISFEFVSYSGELHSYDLTIHPSFDLDFIDIFNDELASFILTSSSILSSIISSGEISNTDLTIFTGQLIDASSYSGQFSETQFSTFSFITSQISTGELGSSSLSTFSSIPLDITGRSGSSSSISVAVYNMLPAIAYDGINGVFNLDYIINEGMPASGYSGSSSVTDIATTFALYASGYSGSSSVTDIATTFALYADGVTGQNSFAILTENLSDQFEGRSYSGQTLTFEKLSTTTIFSSRAYQGQIGSLTLFDSPAYEIVLLAYNGNNATVTLQFPFQLSLNRSYSGEWANVIGMSNENHWYHYSGQFSEVKFSTSYNLPSNSLLGENCYLDLTLAESGPLGLFVIRPGEWADPGLDIRHTSKFRVLFRTSIMTQVDIGSATYFDLTTDVCCPRVTTNNLLFHMERGMIPEEVSYGNRTFMTVDLMCRPRMSVNFYTDEVAAFYEYDFMELSFVQDDHTAELFFDADLYHRLCKGYFIPTGKWIVTELNDVLPEDCYSDRIYSGENLFCEVSDDCVLRVDPFISGENSYSSMIIFAIWELLARSGENVFIQFEWTWKPINAGEVFSLELYAEPIICITGETVEFDLSVAYNIRFLEEGCLENEFVYQDKEGDLIPELFNEVPVEEEPYLHSIKAECY